MILVDSSVWIDFFNGSATPQVEELVALIRSEAVVSANSQILTEVLRGCSSEPEAESVGDLLVALPFLELDVPWDHIEAARLYRRARASGITVRKTVDLMIAATCIKHEAWLLHNDRDFDLLASVSDLKIWNPAA